MDNVKRPTVFLFAAIMFLGSVLGTLTGCDTGSVSNKETGGESDTVNTEADTADMINIGDIGLDGLDSAKLEFIKFLPEQEAAAIPEGKFPLVEDHEVEGGTLTFFYEKDEYCNFYCQWSDGSSGVPVCGDFFTYVHFDGNRFEVAQFKDVLGESGFKITWSNQYNKHHTEYFIYRDGLPVLYFKGDFITETDLDGDGDREILTFGHGNSTPVLYDRRGEDIYMSDIESAIKKYAGENTAALTTYYINDSDSGFKKGCFIFKIYTGFSSVSERYELYAVYNGGTLYFLGREAVVSDIKIDLPKPVKYDNAIPQMTEDEIYNFITFKIKAAYEAYFWFIGDTIPWGIQGVRLDDEGRCYNRIVNVLYPDYASFTAHLVSLFSPEITASLLTGGPDYSKYINYNGELWGIDTTGGRQYNLTYGETNYTITSSTDTEIVIKGILSRMRDITTADSPHIEVALDYYEEYGYTLKYLNGAWVFTEFENYKGRIEPEEIEDNG